MKISIRRDQTKGAQKFNNHKVYADDKLIGYVGHPTVYDHTHYVFICKDDRFSQFDNVTAGKPQDFKAILLNK